MAHVRALLVDDNDAFRTTARGYLERAGCVELVAVATSGEEAVRLAQRYRPDLVFTDLVLPGMNGVETTRRIKDSLPHAVVVILTLYDLAEYRAGAQRAGADALVGKSEFTDKVVRDWVNKAMAQKKCVVLVVDDSLTIRRMVMHALRHLASEFGEATTGLEAIEQLTLHNYDAVMLDLNMPDMHGLEVLRFLRGTEHYRNLPVVVLTTRGDDDTRSQALRAGASAYLTKPFTPADLQEALQGVLAP